jgi:hypothetical protein
MTMDISTEDSPNGMAGRFIAVRPYKGHPSRTDQKFSSEGNHELLAGTWIGMHELGLKIDKESITMGQGDWNREGYRIISWERQEGFARVEVICKEAADRGLIGKRFKMLIRRTSEGDVTLTHYTLPSGKNGEWPKGFDEAFLKADPAGSVTPIDGLRTMIFRVERAR